MANTGIDYISSYFNTYHTFNPFLGYDSLYNQHVYADSSSIINGTLVGNLLKGIKINNAAYPVPKAGKIYLPNINLDEKEIPLMDIDGYHIYTPITTKKTKKTQKSKKTLKTKPSSKEKISKAREEKRKIKPGDDKIVVLANGKVKLGKAVKKRLQEIAKRINCDYKDLLGLIYSESSFRSTNKYKQSAVGLIQFTQICIDDLNNIYHANLTKEKILKMSPLEQLNWAEKSLLRAKRIAGFSENHKLTAAELCAMNLVPKYAKNKIILRKKSKSPMERKRYEQNKGLDLNKDGLITKQELTQRINKASMNILA